MAKSEKAVKEPQVKKVVDAEDAEKKADVAEQAEEAAVVAPVPVGGYDTGRANLASRAHPWRIKRQ